MPVIGQDIPTGVVVEWLKKEGDTVEKEEVIATVESEKAAFDVEAPASGVLLKILRQEGEEVEVLMPIGFVGEPGEVYEDSVNTPPAEKSKEISTNGYEQKHTANHITHQEKKKVVASPLARRVAREMGVALDTVTGTGPGGRIIKKNVLKARQLFETPETPEKEISPSTPETKTDAGKQSKAENIVASQPGDQLVPYSRTRQIIADRMTMSKQTIPHFYLFVEADMDAALVWRTTFNQEHHANITITDLVVQATAAALREYPRMNAYAGQQSMVLKKQINIGIATAVEEGLLVPVIAHTDQKDTMEISREIKQKAEEARKGKLDLHVKATFTISSLGMYGIREFLPIINPPEAGILAIGKVEPKVVAERQMLGVKNRMNLTLACDHRAVDGAYGAQFLYAIKEKLETANFKIFKR